ncbi:hypothetical protein QOZ80_3BG0293270 [Eleusine coracana subsp. coracana]|nr:hypothetical protein QOZ80_3BG0293270 [Eleusine coracana subsp. coracana]
MAPMAMIARAMVVAVLLMQCCNVILAARPLLDAAEDSGRWLGHGGAGSLILQVLQKGAGGGCTNKDGSHTGVKPGGGC